MASSLVVRVTFVTRVCDESELPAPEGSERSESVNLARVSVDLPTVEEAQGCIKERHELRGIAWATALLLIGAILPHARGGPVFGPLVLKLHNLHLHGQVVDFTDYHGTDNRIWSSALNERRSLYVYLPPGFDPSKRYPLVLWLHGLPETARWPLFDALPYFDKAIKKGHLPPVVVAVPDGHIPGSFRDSHFLNSRAGRYEDYLLQDVLPFVEARFPVRPEREAHAIMGFSMSGWAAYSVALKNTARFGAVIGILPPLNMRWVDCHGKFKSQFDPNCWGWRNELDKNELITCAYFIPATLRRAIEPYFGWGPEGLAWLSRENPIELLDRFQIQPNEIAMYIAYIKHDEYMVAPQVESFLYVAHQRGLDVTVDYHPLIPTHNLIVCMNRYPRALQWLGAQLAPYAPPDAAIGCYCCSCEGVVP
jgi:S-formylglutathione hydrolase FrmB